MAKIPVSRLEFLFRPPTSNPIVPGRNSTLHLIRRECQETMCNIKRTVPENRFPGSRKPHRMFASVSVICTAFDLLSKFRFGDRSVGPAFKRVLKKYGGLSAVEARRIYDARNAMVHAFGIRVVRPPSERRQKAKRGGGRFESSVRIQLTWDTSGQPLLRVGKRRWELNLAGLYRVLVKTIYALERDLRRPLPAADVDLFNRMYLRYARIRIQER
jgi:hypothetical protein